jgi:hypothetical protein
MVDAAALSDLPDGWFSIEVAAGVDCSRPGLDEWHIEGVGSYIGKFKRIGRPTQEYGRNVLRLLRREAYRKGKPEGFRRIHRELAEAV